MSIKRKKKLHLKTSTRDLIIEEAERIIARQGIDALKLEAIAHSLGIQRPTLYFHFDGRAGILTSIAERGTIHLCNHFQDDGLMNPVDAIRQGIEDLVRYLREHKAFTLLMARNHSTPDGIPAFNSLLDEKKPQSVPLVAEQLFNRIDGIIKRGCKLGIFEPMDGLLFWTIMVSSISVCVIYPGRQITDLNEIMTRSALGLLLKR